MAIVQVFISLFVGRTQSTDLNLNQKSFDGFCIGNFSPQLPASMLFVPRQCWFKSWLENLKSFRWIESRLEKSIQNAN